MLWMPLVVELKSGQERHLVFGSSPRLAGVHPAEVSVIGQNDPGQRTPRFALGHGLPELVLDPPRGAVAHTPRCRFSECGEVLLLFWVTR
jgi:hypothetical protein